LILIHFDLTKFLLSIIRMLFIIQIRVKVQLFCPENKHFMQQTSVIFRFYFKLKRLLGSNLFIVIIYAVKVDNNLWLSIIWHGKQKKIIINRLESIKQSLLSQYYDVEQ
jgi:hypothetical protein